MVSCQVSSRSRWSVSISSQNEISGVTELIAVIWSKSNPTPWNDIQQEENAKLFNGHHKFEKRCAAFLLGESPEESLILCMQLEARSS